MPALGDLQRRLFVEERRFDTDRPDHFYKAYLEERLGKAKTLSCLAPIILRGMAERFLHRRGGRLHVRTEKLFEWQGATPSLSPLAVAASALASEDVNLLLHDSPARLMADRIRGSAIIGPHLTALDELIDREGLVDIHMHLNGSTEVDRVWADAVMKPLPYLRELRDTFHKSGARELYDQIEAGLTPGVIYGRLRAARRARHVLASEIRTVLDGGVPTWSRDRFLLLFDPRRGDEDAALDLGIPLGRSPYLTLFPAAPDAAPLHAEGAFTAACLQAHTAVPVLDEYIGAVLWHSLTVFTQVARLSVQQPDQIGFHQFDKFNAAGARERLEQSYEERLHQLNGPGPGRLSYVDARFAPKKTTYDTEALLGRVVQGLTAFRGCKKLADPKRPLHGAPPPCFFGDCACPARTDRLDLALVAHFIKLPQRHPDEETASGPDGSCRHASLRHGLEKQSRALSRSVRRSKVLQALVRGVDGAGNELDAPPEVFAPTFRRMRQLLAAGGATFHAGEDFLHLLSGIRAVDEAISFLDLSDGDRIGHAVALGVAPDQWATRVHDRILMPVEDLLDNAVHALSALSRSRKRFGDEALFASWVERYSSEVYGRAIGLATLTDAWSLRRLDVLALRRLELGYTGALDDLAAFAAHLDQTSDTTLDPNLRAEIGPIRKAIADTPEAFLVFRDRHTLPVRRRGARIVEVPVAAGDPMAVSMETLVYLQEDGLRRMGERGVVIETLPSSNVRIGGYKDAGEHHLLRWMGVLPGLEVRPRLALGSDDPGIFSTNIAGEFAHVHAALEAHCADDVMRHLRRLNRTAREVRFKPVPPTDAG